MKETVMLLLGHAFACKVMEKLEKDQKDTITQKEVFMYITQVSFELANELKEKVSTNSTRFDPPQN